MMHGPINIRLMIMIWPFLKVERFWCKQGIIQKQMATVVCSSVTHPSYCTECFHKTRVEIHETCGMSTCKVNAIFFVSSSHKHWNMLTNQDLSELYRVTILTNNYHLPLPLSLFIVINTAHSSHRPHAQWRSSRKEQMMVVSNDPVHRQQ